MADTELKIRISAQLSDAKEALSAIHKQLAAIAQGGAQFGAVATAGFDRMEAAATNAAKAAAEAALATKRVGEALEAANQKARQPLPTPKVPKAPTELAEGVANASAVQRAALKQQLLDLEASHRAGLTETKDYYEQRAQLQRAALQVELRQAQAAYAAAKSQEQRNAATTQQAILQQRIDAIKAPVIKPASMAPVIAAGVADQNAIERAALKQQLADLEAGHKAGLVETKAYYAQRAAIQRAALQTEINAAKAASAAAKTQEQSNAATTRIALLSQRQAAIKAQVPTGKDEPSALVSILGKAKGAAFALGVTLTALGTAKVFLDLADQAKMLEARLRLATGSQQEFATAQAKLFDLSQRTRTDLSSTVDLYTKLYHSTTTLGVSQGELLRVTETITKAFKISGGSAESMNAAIVQLGQGLASGTLRGDELRSVLEQAPRLATAIAAGLGITVDKLRKLGAEGKITSEQILNSLGKQADKIDAEFQQLPHTVDGAMTIVKNALVAAAGEFDKATGASDAFARALEATAPVIISAAHKITVASAELLTSASASFKALEKAAKDTNTNVTKELGDKPGGLIDNMKSAFSKLPSQTVPIVTGWARSWFSSFKALQMQQLNTQRMLTPLSGYSADRFAADTATTVETLREEQRKIANDTQAAIDDAEEAGRKIEEAKKNADELAKKQAETAARTGTKKPGVSIDRREIEKDQLRQQLDDLKRAHDLALLETEDYYHKRLAIQIRMLNLEIEQEQAQARKATTDDARAKALTNIKVLEGKRVELVKQAGNEIYDAERLTQDKLAELRAQALVAEGKTVAARAAELQAQYKETLERFRADGNAEGVTLIERLIGYEQGKAQLAEVGEAIDRIVARFRAAEQSAANNVITGSSSQSGAFEQTRAAASEAVPALRRYREEMAKLAETNKDAADKLLEVDSAIAEIEQKSAGGAARALQNLRTEIAGLQSSFQSDAAFALRDNLKTLFDDIITGSKKGAEAMRDFAKNFAKSILSIMTQLLATQVAKAILSKTTGLFGLLGSVGGAVKHAGGVVGMGGSSRSVPITAFLGAPRLHTGGVLGLYPDEVPTILQRGEEVLSRSDPRNVRNAGAGGKGPSTVLVQLHPDHNHRTMRDWLEGELARVASTS